MDVVVGYRKVSGGSAGRIVGGVVGAVGLLLVLAAVGGFVAGFHLLLTREIGHALSAIIHGGLGLCLLVVGIVVATTTGSKAAKIAAPRGVAWVLERGGVMVPLPGRDVRIPWSQVRFEPTTVAGKPGVRVLGPGVDQAYPAEGLSMGFEQIDAEARRIASGR
ncbi:hypothetical protein GCM10027418_27710 [Mariniluteicoccus endophyticus]